MPGDKPIIFSGPMVRALLDGRKTQTRRVIKAAGRSPEFCGGRYDAKSDPECWGWEDHERGEWITLDQWRRWNFVPFAPGDRLYVREHWSTWGIFDDLAPSKLTGNEGISFIANGHAGPRPGRFRQAMHMPRWASRLTLTVTDVRVQRLQEISREDAIAEGIQRVGGGRLRWERWTGAEGQAGMSPEAAFALLWNSLHGPEAWDANPWVVAVSFTVHRCNIDQMEAAHA